jgi:hypothetical protein
VALGGVCWLAALVCGIIILIDAFKNEIWKGIVSLLCFLYLLYYAFAEFDAENKWLIIAVWLLGGAVGGALMAAGGFAGMVHGAGPVVR